jgi:integrase
MERPNLLPRSAYQMKLACDSFDRWHGAPVLLKELDHMMIIHWMNDQVASGRSPVTVNKKRSSILSLWSAATEDDLAPLRRKKVPKLIQPARIPITWTLKEFEQLLQATELLKGEWECVPISLCWKIALLLVWDTAIRRDGILNARLADVDFNNGTLLVRAEHLKGRKADRVFRLHPQTMALIKESLVCPREKLFPAPRSNRAIHERFRQLLILAGLPTDRNHQFHCIRRTSESYAAASNGAQWAADCVGHGVDVAKRFYINPTIAPRPALIEGLPRPSTTVLVAESTEVFPE